MIKTNNYKYDVFKTFYWNGAELAGIKQMPKVIGTKYLPVDPVSFTERNNVIPSEHTLDFFIDDIFVECLWSNADKYIPLLRKFANVITTDFSMYPEMLPAQREWNCTRNMAMAYYMQINGVKIIPAASWCDPGDFSWCFDALPNESSIAVSNNGCLSNPESMEIFLLGTMELIKRKKPYMLIICGKEMPELAHYSNIIYYPSYAERLKSRLRA